MAAVLVALAVAGPLTAQPPAPPPPVPAVVAPPAFRVDVALAPMTDRAGELTVGDRVEAILTLKLPAGRLSGPPRFPVWRDTWGDVEIREQAPAQKVSAEGDTVVYRQRLVLAPWKVGRAALPPAVVAVPLAERTVEARTPADLFVDVVSVLPRPKPGEAPPGPKPAAPMVPLPLGKRFWWTASLLAAACALGGALLARQRSQALAAAAAPALAPYEALLAALGGLESEPSSLRVHTGLSHALRSYLGRTLSFPAAESTTSEVQRQLTARHLTAHLPAALPRRAGDLLRGCDLVKFARQEVGLERTRERLATAHALAAELERHVHPPAEAAAAIERQPPPLQRAAG